MVSCRSDVVLVVLMPRSMVDKTWDAQNYVLRELKSGRSPNHPCNSVGLGDGVILRKTEQFPSRFSFV